MINMKNKIMIMMIIVDDYCGLSCFCFRFALFSGSKDEILELTDHSTFK